MIEENILKRIEEAEFYLFDKKKDGKNPTVFDEIDNRIIKVQGDMLNGL
jgi:hypothetical protein